jgi:hypothetical protein
MIRLLQSRPALSDRLILRTAAPLAYNTSYVVEINGVRNVNQVATRALGGLKTPAPPPPPKAATDSTQADSTARPTRPGRPKVGDRPRPTTPGN